MVKTLHCFIPVWIKVFKTKLNTGRFYSCNSHVDWLLSTLHN